MALSLEMARIMTEKLSGSELEIHVDVGQRGETRAMIKEVAGMITGFGFSCKTKPDSFGASHVADKHT